MGSAILGSCQRSGCRVAGSLAGAVTDGHPRIHGSVALTSSRGGHMGLAIEGAFDASVDDALSAMMREAFWPSQALLWSSRPMSRARWRRRAQRKGPAEPSAGSLRASAAASRSGLMGAQPGEPVEDKGSD